MIDPASRWLNLAAALLERARSTAAGLDTGFPHWANAQNGKWTTTPDGDWTGGAMPGLLWLGYALTREERLRDVALQWCLKLAPRAHLETAFKGFGFYYGAALGDLVTGNGAAADLALAAARSLRDLYDPRLGLIPLGKDAEEASHVGAASSSIDSLQATPLLYWAAGKTGDSSYAQRAASHTSRVLDIHCRADGGIIQSSELDASNGALRRHFTHKGVSDTSVWARAQAWGMLYAAMAFARDGERTRWLEQAMSAADWWLHRVPPDMVAFWDFDDPAIPDTDRDTAATAIVCVALLKLAELAPTSEQRSRYRDAAERTAHALVSGYLTPIHENDHRPSGMLIGGCFNKRRDARPQDSITNAELIFGSYYLFEALLILGGAIGPLFV